MATPHFKVGDKVQRLPTQPWPFGDLIMTIDHIDRTGQWVIFEEDPNQGEWGIDNFKLATEDTVNHPPHYNTGAVETIDYIAQITKLYPGDEGYLIGNVLKYVSRAPVKKDKLKDLKKAQWYLNRLVDHLDKPNTDTGIAWRGNHRSD